MALKRRISYHWRLLIPIAALIAAVVGCLVWYQLRREAMVREDLCIKELELIQNRIIYAKQRDENPRSFLEFVSKYYRNSLYEGVRISVYGSSGQLLYSQGEPLPQGLTEKEFIEYKKGRFKPDEATANAIDDVMYFTTVESQDGDITVMTALPKSEDLSLATGMDSGRWTIISLLMLIAVIITYFYTRTLTRSVSMLSEFASKAAQGVKSEKEYNFPHNELGDISRQIVKLYTEREKAFEQINRERKVAMHAIEERIATTRQITNNVNHEIKTPVGIIKGYLETIVGNPDMDEESRNRFLSRMLINVDRLCNLLNDISTMTRLENGAGKIPLERVDMHDLIYQIENDLLASNIAGEMNFTYSVPFDCNVKGNYGLITGMINGLIRNAAMYSGGTEIGFRLVSESDRFYVFSFYDNGKGVSDEHLAHLFERFYRVDTGRSRQKGGTGLGLSIVKSTILSLGGTISVHNRSTGGLEFIFTIPRWE